MTTRTETEVEHNPPDITASDQLEPTLTVPTTLTSGALSWSSWDSGCGSGGGALPSSESSTEGDSSSRQEVPGMMPADFAARSMAPEEERTSEVSINCL